MAATPVEARGGVTNNTSQNSSADLHNNGLLRPPTTEVASRHLVVLRVIVVLAGRSQQLVRMIHNICVQLIESILTIYPVRADFSASISCGRKCAEEPRKRDVATFSFPKRKEGVFDVVAHCVCVFVCNGAPVARQGYTFNFGELFNAVAIANSCQ